MKITRAAGTASPGLLARAWNWFIGFFISPVIDQTDEDASDNQTW